LEIVESAAPRTTDVLTAARQLVGKVDAIYVPTDNTIVSAFEAVSKVGNDAKIPVFAGDTSSVARGAVAAVGFNYYDLGRQTGHMVLRIFKGEKPGDIAVEGVDIVELHINKKAALSQGATFPDAVIKRAHYTIE
jgi:putative ABC transport system substrate-binding protein